MPKRAVDPRRFQPSCDSLPGVSNDASLTIRHAAADECGSMENYMIPQTPIVIVVARMAAGEVAE